MMERLETIYLLAAGAVALLIGLGMVALPDPFYAGYGIDPAASTDLANELRSPGLWFVLVGATMGLGPFRPGLGRIALGIAAAFYLSYAAARGVSLVLDGLPGSGMLLAMMSELLLGTIGALLVWRRRSTRR
ncbi:DUF4345 domain-containing protein [Pelagibacterium flavum]|uniref:DUF4345 domain-containing protein n=1 Tax=Pelagibacterium flavum TaxID=2984530 RepID=A0ABY6ITP1_9HYPH|nr:DUF4345 domain-containing protein [Pelagibacterium sp. YIM 151497]UYQ74011.1 DUF4345 domain-containing protein [Pelagibacterium sp. YIM 151497]